MTLPAVLKYPAVKMSRAGFFKACGMVLLGPRLYAAGAIRQYETHPAPVPLPLTSFSADLFRPCIGTVFSCEGTAGAKTLVLAKVTERPVQRHVAQFSLIFHGAPGTDMGDGTCLFRHAVLGSFDLFIVPIGSGNGRRSVYQACFSRYVKTRDSAAEGLHHV
jgi:hypothetical protein